MRPIACANSGHGGLDMRKRNAILTCLLVAALLIGCSGFSALAADGSCPSCGSTNATLLWSGSLMGEWNVHTGDSCGSECCGATSSNHYDAKVEKSYRCNNCGTTYNTYYYSYEHHASCGTHTEQYVAFGCDKSFLRLGYCPNDFTHGWQAIYMHRPWRQFGCTQCSHRHYQEWDASFEGCLKCHN